MVEPKKQKYINSRVPTTLSTIWSAMDALASVGSDGWLYTVTVSIASGSNKRNDDDVCQSGFFFATAIVLIIWPFVFTVTLKIDLCMALSLTVYTYIIKKNKQGKRKRSTMETNKCFFWIHKRKRKEGCVKNEKY